MLRHIVLLTFRPEATEDRIEAWRAAVTEMCETSPEVLSFTLGANVGTTITAILAALSTGNPAAVTVALAHLTFNVMGIAIFYPLKAIPIWLANKAGAIAGKSKGNSAMVITVYVLLHIIPIAYVFMRR